MGTLYLIRHGQASLGAADYDQLSPLGQRQSQLLGEYFARTGIDFEAVHTGTLRRHLQTWQGIASGMQKSIPAQHWPGLNEYNSDALVRAVQADDLPRPDTPEGYRQHFRLLRTGLHEWMHGTIAPEGMPSYLNFVAGIQEVLDHVRSAHSGNVLLVSSGGPISTAIGSLLGAPAQSTIELNMRLRNSAVSEFVYTAKRHALLSFNTLPHLDPSVHAEAITYA
jgi:broad specificity phosphatase PhoE